MPWLGVRDPKMVLWRKSRKVMSERPSCSGDGAVAYSFLDSETLCVCVKEESQKGLPGSKFRAKFGPKRRAIFAQRLSHIIALSLIDLLLYVMSDNDELIQIKPSEVHFVEELRRSERGAIFRVMVRGRHCAMKVVNYLYLYPALHGSL